MHTNHTNISLAYANGKLDSSMSRHDIVAHIQGEYPKTTVSPSYRRFNDVLKQQVRFHCMISRSLHFYYISYHVVSSEYIVSFICRMALILKIQPNIATKCINEYKDLKCEICAVICIIQIWFLMVLKAGPQQQKGPDECIPTPFWGGRAEPCV